MAFELPAINSFISRMPNPELHLAAFGGLALPLAWLIEAPVIMFLAASAAFSNSRRAYDAGYRVMMITCAGLTALHGLICIEPLFSFVVDDIFSAPPELHALVRQALIILLPWTWAIGHRRFNQGFLIRFGKSKHVGFGTAIRLSTGLIVLAIGFLMGTFPGSILGAIAASAAVVSEALYIHIQARRLLRPGSFSETLSEPFELSDTTVESTVTISMTGQFLKFYLPLALTTIIDFLDRPLGVAGLTRMPLVLESLALWPVVSGLLMPFRNLGHSYKEVVVTMLNRPGYRAPLRKVALSIGSFSALAFIITVFSPLSSWIFSDLFAIPPSLLPLAKQAIWLTLPFPFLSAFQSWFQGVVIFNRQSRRVTESIGIYLATFATVIGFGTWYGEIPGLYVVLTAVLAAALGENCYLGFHAGKLLAAKSEA